MEKSKVWLRRCSGLTGTPLEYGDDDSDRILRCLEDMVDTFPDFSKRVSRSRVLLKPNLVRPTAAVPAMTTDRRVISALVRLFRDGGAAEVAIGEKPGYGFPGTRAFHDAGYFTSRDLKDVTFIAFDESPWVRADNPGATVFHRPLLPKSVFDFDLLINVPKMKTHMHTLVSLGLKNFQGLVADDERMLFHRCDLNDKIVDTVLARQPDFTIIDGLWPMEGQAPFHGKAIPDFNVLVAGDRVTEVDAVTCSLMGISPEEVSHLRIARAKGLGSLDLDAITIVGDKLSDLIRPFRRPIVSSAGVFPGIHSIEAGVCQGCLSAIRHSLDKVHFEGVLESLPEITIVSGRSLPNQQTLPSWRGDLWLFGNCAVEYLFPDLDRRLKPCFLQGCPPHVLDLHHMLHQTYRLSVGETTR